MTRFYSRTKRSNLISWDMNKKSSRRCQKKSHNWSIRTLCMPLQCHESLLLLTWSAGTTLCHSLSILWHGCRRAAEITKIARRVIQHMGTHHTRRSQRKSCKMYSGWNIQQAWPFIAGRIIGIRRRRRIRRRHGHHWTCSRREALQEKVRQQFKPRQWRDEREWRPHTNAAS